MGKTPDEMTASMVANMPEKTGKSLDEWLAVATAASCAKHGELVKHLKTTHGMTHGFANLVAHFHFQQPTSAGNDVGDDLVASQYAGAKTALRPIYDKLIAILKSFGDDVDVAPKKAYVSLRRNKQFAIIQPSTATRLDLGINLKGVEPAGRLEASGSFNAMVSHRVRIGEISDVNDEISAWLKAAYDAA